jgi:hypothetical protein
MKNFYECLSLRETKIFERSKEDFVMKNVTDTVPVMSSLHLGELHYLLHTHSGFILTVLLEIAGFINKNSVEVQLYNNNNNMFKKLKNYGSYLWKIF